MDSSLIMVYLDDGMHAQHTCDAVALPTGAQKKLGSTCFDNRILEHANRTYQNFKIDRQISFHFFQG